MSDKRVNHARFEDVIDRVERLANTRDGNPVWEVYFRSGKRYRTKPDAQVGHKIGNSEFHGVPVTVVLEFANGRDVILTVVKEGESE